MCLCEVARLIRPQNGWEAEIRLLESLSSGEMFLDGPQPPDFARIAGLVAQYRDLPLGTVDASVVACAERLDATQVATLDRRHFAVVRPLHVEVFELVP